MSILRLYNSWVDSPAVTEEDLRRIGLKAFKGVDAYLLEDVLEHAKCPQDFWDMVKNSGNVFALSVWLKTSRCTNKEFEWFIFNHSTELIRNTTHLQSGYEEEQGRIVWRKNDSDLRVYLLKMMQYQEVAIPQSWGKWFFETLAKESDLSSLLADIAHRYGVSSFWDVAIKLGKLKHVCLVYAAMPSSDRDSELNDLVQDKIEKYLANPRSVKLSLADLVPAVGAILEYTCNRKGPRDDWARLKAKTLGARFAELLPESDPMKVKLQEYINFLDGEPQGGEVNLEDVSIESLLNMLFEGDLPEEVISRACSANAMHHLDPLWRAVASHPKLTPEDVNSLLYKTSNGFNAELAEIISEKRSTSWLEETAFFVWKEEHESSIGTYLLQLLPTESIKKVVKDILNENVWHANRLVSEDVLTDYTIGSVPVEQIMGLYEKTQHAFLDLAHKELGDNAVAWEIFDTLLDSPGQVTCGAILETSLALAEDTQK